MWNLIKGKRIVGLRHGEHGYTGSKGFQLLLEDGTKIVVDLKQDYDDSWIDYDAVPPFQPKDDNTWLLLDEQEPPKTIREETRPC